MEERKRYNGAAIQVHQNQKGNPVLKAITATWAFEDNLLADFIVGKKGNFFSNHDFLIIIVQLICSLHFIPVNSLSQSQTRLHP
jgi:hypothetical protein